MSALTFPTGTYHFNDHPLFDFQLNRVVMWNHGNPAEIQARGEEITDFPSWERVLKEPPGGGALCGRRFALLAGHARRRLQGYDSVPRWK